MPTFFFQPVQLYLQPADLLIKGIVVRLFAGRLAGPAVHEKIRQLVNRRFGSQNLAQPFQDCLSFGRILGAGLLRRGRLGHHPNIDFGLVRLGDDHPIPAARPHQRRRRAGCSRPCAPPCALAKPPTRIIASPRRLDFIGTSTLILNLFRLAVRLPL